MATKKVLFILKRKEDFDPHRDSKIGLTTGLYNSASFVNKMLQDIGVESNMEVVIDNNDIDREVTKYKPTHVIVEALWVVPSKFTILTKLHPNVTWIVRLHSETPFLAGEGMAFDWIGDYIMYPNIILGVNAPRMLDEIRFYLRTKLGCSLDEISRRVVYMPNYYPTDYKTKIFNGNKSHIDIGCFGAVRPLKNHMLQALGALQFAQDRDKKLRFHINSERLEMNGSPVLHNLRGLFSHLYDQGHELVSHGWSVREDFLNLCSSMDIGMQVSFSETFNIVGADVISQGIPLIGTYEIPWMVSGMVHEPSSSTEISSALNYTFLNPDNNVSRNQVGLTNYVNNTKEIWKSYFI